MAKHVVTSLKMYCTSIKNQMSGMMNIWKNLMQRWSQLQCMYPGEVPMPHWKKWKILYDKSMDEALNEIKVCEEVVMKEMMPELLLHGSNKFSILATYVHGDNSVPWISRGNDEYIEAYTKTTRGQQKEKMPQKTIENQIEVFSAQSDKERKSKRNIGNMTCHHCSKLGHCSKECTKKNNWIHAAVADDEEDDTVNYMKHTFHQVGHDKLSRDWLLLNNESTVDQVVNDKHLTKFIQQSSQSRFCIAGSTTTNERGVFGKFRML